MIVTVTPNPSLDRTARLAELRRGEVNRAEAVRLDPGGKGVNVARALAAAGTPTVALLPAGGLVGERLADLLAPEGVPVVAVPIAGTTRSNITLVEADGTTTKINEPGPEISPPSSRRSNAAPSSWPHARNGWCAAEASPPAYPAISTRGSRNWPTTPGRRSPSTPPARRSPPRQRAGPTCSSRTSTS